MQGTQDRSAPKQSCINFSDPDATGGFAATIAVLVWVVAGLAWLASIVNIIATTMTRQAQHLGKKVADASAPILKGKNLFEPWKACGWS